MQDTILKIEHISKFYPGVTALNDVSFEIKKGEVRALVGENGAGKSTLIKCIMGVERPDEGQISMRYDDRWIVNTNALEAQSHGVYANYQHVNIAPDLSIAENYYLGRQPRTKLGAVDWRKMADDSKKIIDKFIAQLSTRLEQQNISVQVSDGAKEEIAREGFDPTFGARPLKRFIQGHIETLVAKEMIKGSIQKDDNITIDYQNQQFMIRKS